MNRLPRDKQIQIIHALCEGMSIRGTERLFNVHRDTVMRLMIRTGKHCATILDELMTDIPAGTYQVDEVWTFVHKKQNRLTPEDRIRGEFGDQYIWIAMDADTKLIPTYCVGKRVSKVAYDLMSDLRDRLDGRPTIITDGFDPYIEAVERAFGADVDFAQLIKTVSEIKKPVREGYVPAIVVRCDKRPITGKPQSDLISTSLIERQNLTVRTFMKRLNRLSLAFSKKLDNLKAATALHFAHYNLCRVHGTLRMTPAMEAGIAESIWEISDLVPN